MHLTYLLLQLTLGENIADNEGLSATYDAYLNSKATGHGYNPILPGLQQFSPEALFFINAGRSFCSKPLRGTIKDSVSATIFLTFSYISNSYV